MKETYEDIWRVGSPRIQAGTVECDERIDDPEDSRLGLTIIFRFDASISERFLEFMEAAKKLEPDIYTYSGSELHSTVLSIVTCVENYRFDPATQIEYEKAIGPCLDITEPLVLDFRGITASPSCVMAQGYPHGSGLEWLRDTLRATLRDSSLQQTIDQRYKISTAHSTLIRFRKPLVSAGRFHDLISSHRDTFWGSQRVSRIHLVLNDWYHKSSKVIDLASFDL